MSQSLMKTAILLLRLLLHGLLPPASSAASVGVDVAAAGDDDDDDDGDDISDNVRRLLPAFSSEIRQPRFLPLSLAVMSSMLRVHALLRLAIFSAVLRLLLAALLLLPRPIPLILRLRLAFVSLRSTTTAATATTAATSTMLRSLMKTAFSSASPLSS